MRIVSHHRATSHDKASTPPSEQVNSFGVYSVSRSWASNLILVTSPYSNLILISRMPSEMYLRHIFLSPLHVPQLGIPGKGRNASRGPAVQGVRHSRMTVFKRTASWVYGCIHVTIHNQSHLLCLDVITPDPPNDLSVPKYTSRYMYVAYSTIAPAIYLLCTALYIRVLGGPWRRL